MNFGLVAILLAPSFVLSWPVKGQELEPRAYSVSPVGVNIALLSYSYPSGDVELDPSLPIEDVKAKLNVLTLGYFRSLNFFGRSANISGLIPYTDGVLTGSFFGDFQRLHRSGLRDPAMRFAANLYGAPAMNFTQFSTYHQRINLSASVTTVVPLGQYDQTNLVNLGSNRWAVKSELGFSQGITDKWILELDAGAWLFTANHMFLGATKTQNPIIVLQAHAVYTMRPRLWFSLDVNCYDGGRTTVQTIQMSDLQRGSRGGITVAAPIEKRQTLKLAYSRWAFATFGARFNVFTLAYQLIWGGGL